MDHPEAVLNPRSLLSLSLFLDSSNEPLCLSLSLGHAKRSLRLGCAIWNYFLCRPRNSLLALEFHGEPREKRVEGDDLGEIVNLD